MGFTPQSMLSWLYVFPQDKFSFLCQLSAIMNSNPRELLMYRTSLFQIQHVPKLNSSSFASKLALLLLAFTIFIYCTIIHHTPPSAQSVTWEWSQTPHGPSFPHQSSHQTLEIKPLEELMNLSAPCHPHCYCLRLGLHWVWTGCYLSLWQPLTNISITLNFKSTLSQESSLSFFYI